jgi:hypothetical protein
MSDINSLSRRVAETSPENEQKLYTPYKFELMAHAADQGHDQHFSFEEFIKSGVGYFVSIFLFACYEYER